MTTRIPGWDIESEQRIIIEARREQAAVFAKYMKGAAAAIARAVTAVARSVVRATAQARQLAELSRLSDRQLADMGISRADIPRFVVGDRLVDVRRLSVPGLKGWTPEQASNDWHGSAAA